MKMQSIGLALLAWGCGQSQSPSFKDNTSTTRIALTVDEEAPAGQEDTTAEEAAGNLGGLSEDEIDSILAGVSGNDSLDGDGSGESASADAVTAPGSTDNDSAGDGAVLPDGVGTDSDGVAGAGGTTNPGTEGGGTGGDSPVPGGQAGDETLADTGGSAAGSEGMPGSGTGGSSDHGSPSTGAGDSGGFGGPEGDGGEGNDLPSAAEIAACAKLNGIRPGAVKVAGSLNQVTISAKAVVAVKVTGNQNHLELSLAGKAGIAGLCVFVAGNQCTASVDIGVSVGNIIYIGRGNHSRGELEINKPATVSNLLADLSGNQASLSVRGDGTYSCSGLRLRGNQPGFSCER